MKFVSKRVSVHKTFRNVCVCLSCIHIYDKAAAKGADANVIEEVMATHEINMLKNNKKVPWKDMKDPLIGFLKDVKDK